MVTLTHHKKSVRALAIHPTEYTFASASAGGNNIKKWKCPEGTFVFNFSGHNAIINTLSVNSEGVFFSGGDNGSLTLWDWNTGTAFQNMDDIPQPGSLEAEAGVFCSTFDVTGTRLITGGADKTIKVRGDSFCEYPNATHGIVFVGLCRAGRTVVLDCLCCTLLYSLSYLPLLGSSVTSQRSRYAAVFTTILRYNPVCCLTSLQSLPYPKRYPPLAWICGSQRVSLFLSIVVHRQYSKSCSGRRHLYSLDGRQLTGG